jgi:PTH1 family peptidyl-tRNA hydrolase
MKILIGLGNPGEKYQNNRHNVGHMFIDYLFNELTSLRVDELREKNKLIAKVFSSNNLILAKTFTYMNNSGKAIKIILNTLHVSRDTLYIIHDDLDIPLGKFKIQFAQGPKLHNGIKSIEETLKSKDFWRIRIGVDNRKKENWIDGETYVLQDFLPEEKKFLTQQVFPKIFQLIKK